MILLEYRPLAKGHHIIKMTPIKRAMQTGEELLKDEGHSKTQTAFAPLLALDLYPPPLRPNGIHGDEDHH